MRTAADRELLSSRPDVWAVLAEPFRLSDWWPGVAGVHPDRHGTGMGARWQVVRGSEPSLFRRPAAADTLVVRGAAPPRLFAFELVRDRLQVRVELEAAGPDRTHATVTVEGPWLIADRRTLARRAVNRLYALCQTAAII